MCVCEIMGIFKLDQRYAVKVCSPIYHNWSFWCRGWRAEAQSLRYSNQDLTSGHLFAHCVRCSGSLSAKWRIETLHPDDDTVVKLEFGSGDVPYRSFTGARGSPVWHRNGVSAPMPNIFCFHRFYSLDLSWYLQSKPLMSKTRLTTLW